LDEKVMARLLRNSIEEKKEEENLVFIVGGTKNTNKIRNIKELSSKGKNLSEVSKG
jgi:3-phosphoglycerate kinase